MTFKSLSALTATVAILGLAAPVAAEPSVGAYLAARQARYDSDYQAEAKYFARVLASDPSNPAILESALAAYLRIGDVERALPLAQQIEAEELRSQVANMVLVADEAQREAYDALLERVDDNRGVGSLADGLFAAWSHLGKGDMRTALAKFDEVAEQRGLRSFANYHKALALASVGDFEAADEIFSGKADGPLQRTRRGTIAWAEVLSQLERNEEAVALIDDAFGSDLDLEIGRLRERLAAGERIPFELISHAKDGLAEVFYSIGQALSVDSGENYTLLYSRVAEYLRPGHIDAIMLSGELLDTLNQFEMATETYKRVPRDHPAFTAAELGRAESLRRADKTDAAVEVLQQLIQSHPELPVVHVSAGDLYRQLERYKDAAEAYDRALEIYAESETEQWFVFYARGISYERVGDWQKAEADFRKALELNPEQPQVLNYLGYTLVEKQIKLDEALDMIERAVAKRPNNGYIVDSLGWVLYRLGRYEEAVGHMEHAAELEPVDPVVNDHLGDVLWAVGRYTEAEFQWKRALSFIEEDFPAQDIDPDRIRRKLEVGLDQVLAEEGSPPLEIADDGG